MSSLFAPDRWLVFPHYHREELFSAGTPLLHRGDSTRALNDLYQVPLTETHEGVAESDIFRFKVATGWGFAMGSPISLRGDFDAPALRLVAKRTRDADQGRRPLALATIYDGGSRGDAARVGCVGPQTVRDWVLRFNAAGPDGLIDGKAPGQTPKLNAAQRAALAGIVEEGSIPARHPTSRRPRSAHQIGLYPRVKPEDMLRCHLSTGRQGRGTAAAVL